MAISYVGKGTFQSGAGAITPGFPSGLADDDLLISVLETANQAITHSSWTQVPDSPQGTGTAGAAGGVRLTAFYKFYASGDTAPATSDSGDHQAGIIIAFRGVDTVTPFEDTAGNTSAAANTHNLPAPVVSTAGAMAAYLVAMDRDIATSNTQFRDAEWLCAALDSGAAVEAVDEFSSAGSGGGVGVAYQTVTTPATLSSGTVRLAGTNSFAVAMLALVLKPASSGTTHAVTEGEMDYGGQAIASIAATVHAVTAAVMDYGGQSIGSGAGTTHVVSPAAMTYGGQAIASIAATTHAVTAALKNYAGQVVASIAATSHAVGQAIKNYGGQAIDGGGDGGAPSADANAPGRYGKYFGYKG